MKNKNLIIGAAAVAVILGLIFMGKGLAPKKAVVKKGPVAAKAQKAKVEPKKIFAKDMGGLTVKSSGSKAKPVTLMIKAFRVTDSKSSTYVASFNTNNMYQLPSGSYDIEVNTIPQKIYRGLRVSAGRETVEDLGSITGLVAVRVLSSENKETYYPVKILYPKSNIIVTATTTSRPVEVIAGTYDIEIATSPAQFKKDVKVESGKEVIVDLGRINGRLLVRVTDENGKEARPGIRIKKTGSSETVASTVANRPIELVQGSYDVEVLSSPRQEKKGVKITAGEEVNEEFIVKAPPQAAAPAAPRRTKR